MRTAGKLAGSSLSKYLGSRTTSTEARCRARLGRARHCFVAGESLASRVEQILGRFGRKSNLPHGPMFIQSVKPQNGGRGSY